MKRFLIPSLFLMSIAQFALAAADCPLPETVAGCAAHKECIATKRFNAITEKDPKKECSFNNNAGWDRAISSQFGTPDNGSTNVSNAEELHNTLDGTVCQAAYLSLRKAVSDYLVKSEAACRANVEYKTKCANLASLDQARSLECDKFNTRAFNANTGAREALRAARREAADYRSLTERVTKKYDDDSARIKKMRDKKEPFIESKLALMSALRRDASGVDSVLDKPETGLLGKLHDDVDARNGGASSLADYDRSIARLKKEQEMAASTITDFDKAADAEIVDIGARVDPSSGARRDPSGGNNGGGNNRGSGSDIVSPKDLMAASSAASAASQAMQQSGSSGGSAMSSLASAAVVPAATAAAAPSRRVASGELDSKGSSSGASKAPVPGSTSPVTPLDGGRDISSGGLGNISERSKKSRSLGGDASGSSTKASFVGNIGGSGGGKTNDGGGIGKAGGAKGDDEGVMNDLKTTQFNAGGSLGTPRIGSSDPAFSTSGALDNLLGPLALDPLKSASADASRAGSSTGLMGGMLDSLGLGGRSSDSSLSDGTQSANAEVAAANEIRSLFDRVHGVHENAQRRGSIVMFHKKL